MKNLFGNFLALALGMVLVLTLLTAFSPSGAAKKKATSPNIIYIMADDLTTQAISAYGGIYKDIAPTPHIDRLAQEGMLFQDVLCTNAICGPSRAAILTGKYSHQNGFYKNEGGGQFDSTQWTFLRNFNKTATKLPFRKMAFGHRTCGLQRI
ncbi:MAG: sulfatase-like hydrolase/transferase [Saprospiraceae bacterium]